MGFNYLQVLPRVPTSLALMHPVAGNINVAARVSMSESVDNLSSCSHDITEFRSLDQISNSWTLDIEDLGNPLETTVGGTQQQASAPLPTYTPIPSDDSDTSWDCVEAASSHPHSHSAPLRFQPKRSP